MMTSLNGISTYIYTGTKVYRPDQPDLLFIHGAANDHSVWALQSRYFAHHGWNVLAPDLPGHGQSAGTVLESVGAIAQWCEALVESIVPFNEQGKRLAVVGHSMGSLAAIALAARLQDRCSHVALLGSAAPMGVSDALLEAARDTPDTAYKMIVQWAYAPAAHLGFNKAPGLWMTGGSLALMRRSAPGLLHRDLLNCKAFADDGLACAARVRGKVLVLSARNDLMTPAKSVAPLVAALQANAQVKLTTTTLNDCGHTMMSEKPEEVLAALKGLLQ
jgi:pimeloyl-ACP methyl ester carboxylesterase